MPYDFSFLFAESHFQVFHYAILEALFMLRGFISSMQENWLKLGSHILQDVIIGSTKIVITMRWKLPQVFEKL
jgi:hypothetical protein